MEPELAYLDYLSRYQPQVFARWMHLIRKHPRLVNRDCGCAELIENREEEIKNGLQPD